MRASDACALGAALVRAERHGEVPLHTVLATPAALPNEMAKPCSTRDVRLVDSPNFASGSESVPTFEKHNADCQRDSAQVTMQSQLAREENESDEKRRRGGRDA